MRILITLLAFFALPAYAADVTIQWQLPTEDCNGNPVAVEQVEILIDTASIPASDQLCPREGGTVDAVPTGLDQVIDAGDRDGSLTVNLTAGQTYYARMRVRTGFGWTNLSNEMSVTIPPDAAPGSAPILLNFGG